LEPDVLKVNQTLEKPIL